jgi:hypothetical protein
MDYVTEIDSFPQLPPPQFFHCQNQADALDVISCIVLASYSLTSSSVASEGSALGSGVTTANSASQDAGIPPTLAMRA